MPHEKININVMCTGKSWMNAFPLSRDLQVDVHLRWIDRISATLIVNFVGACPQSPVILEWGESPLQNQNSNSIWRHFFTDLCTMLHVVLMPHRIKSFIQVENRVIHELHLRNNSVAICATLKLRLIHFFVASQASRQSLLKQHLCCYSSNSPYTSHIAGKSL